MVALRRDALFLVFPVVLVLASGCSNIRLSEDARHSIRHVSVDPQILETVDASSELPVRVESKGLPFYTPWLIAPLGIAIDLIFWKENEERRSLAFLHRLKNAEIDVAGIVRGEFQKTLAKSRVFPIRQKEADAEFRLAVEHALKSSWALHGSWKPSMAITGSLVDREGNVLWRYSADIGSGDAIIPQIDHPFQKPERTRSCYRIAARLVTKALLEHLEGASS
jgi:hypothetical protein